MSPLEEFQHAEVLNDNFGIERRVRLDTFESEFVPVKSEVTLKVVGTTIGEFYSSKEKANVYVVYSKPAEYVDITGNYKIIDLVVAGKNGESEESVRERFDAQVKFADEYRSLAKEYAKNEIVPLLKQFEGVNCIYGRGDIFDKARVPSTDMEHSSDIDLMLFVDSTDEKVMAEYTARFEHYVQKHPEVVFTFHTFNVTDKGYVGDMHVISAHKEKQPILVSIDVMPIDPLLTLAKSSTYTKLSKLLNPYAVRSLTGGGEVLWSQDGAETDQIPLDANYIEGKEVTNFDINQAPKLKQLQHYVYKFAAAKGILESGASSLDFFDESWVSQ